MSELRPKGVPITLLDGVERHLLFTLAAVDEIQDKYDAPVADVLNMFLDDRQTYQTLSYIMTVLINDEIARTGSTEQPLTQQQVKYLIDVPMAEEAWRAIMTAYGFSLPDADDEDDDPNVTGSLSS